MHIQSLKKAREVSASILEEEKISLYSDFDIIGKLPSEFSYNTEKVGICVSLVESKKPFEYTLEFMVWLDLF